MDNESQIDIESQNNNESEMNVESYSSAVALYDKHKIIDANESFANIFGYTRQEITGIYINDLFTVESYLIAIKNRVFGNERVYNLDCRNKKKDIFKCEISNKVFINNDKTVGVLTAKLIDIKKVSSVKQYDKYSALFEKSFDGIFMCTMDGKYQDANQAFINMLGYRDKKELLAQVLPEQFFTSNVKNMFDIMKEPELYETKLLKKDGSEIVVEVGVSLVYEGTNSSYIQCIVRDVTLKKQSEEKIRILSFHDSLTGLYNRALFEEEIARLDNERYLPLSIIMADVNGLKLINDTFGHDEGDELLKRCADILKNCCRKGDIIARWGGDEFTMLLPNTFESGAEEILRRINNEYNHYKDLKISLNISVGYATKNIAGMDIRKTIKEAEDSMYTNKLINSKSVSDSIFASLKRMLYEKSIETEVHAERLKNLSVKLGKAIGLPTRKLEELVLLASLHDIGKVVIPEDILKKEGELTPDEWEIIKKHPTTGYRIVLSSSQLSPISKGILYHHERWDGTGYPHGLSEENIPITSRIISIVDAYDAMVNGRPYKKPINENAAINELKRCAGKQFDAFLVDQFIPIEKKI